MAQDSENWTKLQDLFHLAEEVSEEDRERVLAEQCPDPALRRRVTAMLRGASEIPREPMRQTPSSSGRIGPYVVLKQLGAGGIGSVYLVERRMGGTIQRSALKMLAPHAAGPAFIERFQREQHILSSLDHPNITRMLDAGLTESGQPYLVMEYVKGQPIDTYCDERRLGIEERLGLFLQVCEAVSYAHRVLIVHLDLKPSNILVSEDGSVKLLDFGTSKLIQTDSLLTTTVLATPAYASPEQLRNEPVTTACDVYSLGAVLFELLSGRRPGEKASVALMIERAMNESDPEKLSKAVTAEAAGDCGLSEERLRQVLRGDLETITEKCLRPRAKDRYASVDALSQDVRHYLENRPVAARPRTTFYRMGKFVRRNRKMVALAAASAIVVIGVMGYAEVKQRKAIEEGRRAERMQNFMYSLFRLANSGYMGKKTASVPEFLQLGVRVLPQYIHDPADLRAAQMSLAKSMGENDDLDDEQRIYSETDRSAKASGDVNAEAESETALGEIAYIKGDAQRGATMAAQALELSRDAKVSPLVRANSELLYAFNRDNQGFRTDENLRMIERAIEEERKSDQPPNELGFALRLLADDLLDRGRYHEAEPYLIQAQRTYGNDPALLCGRALVEGDLGFVMGKQGDLQGAIDVERRAYEDTSTCSGEDSHQTAYEATYLAASLIKAGRAPEAVQLMEKVTPSFRKVGGGSSDFSDSLRVLSEAYLKTGQLQKAEDAVKEAIAIRTGKSAPSHPVFGVLHLLYGQILLAEHREREALPQAEMANRILSVAASETPSLSPYAAEAAKLLATLHTEDPPKS